VKCLVRPKNTNLKWLKNLPVEKVYGDIFDPSSYIKSLEDVDYIIHIAGITKAKKKKDYFRGNARATKELLSAACKFHNIKKFCFLSSLSVLGPSSDGTPFDENAPYNPITSYAQSKYEAEIICKDFMDKTPIVILRPPAVYGPRDSDILEIFKFLKYGIKPIIGSEKKTLSLIHVFDLARGIIQATVSDKTASQVYHIADPTIHVYANLLSYVASLMQRKTVTIHIPAPILYTVSAITQSISYIKRKPAILNIEKARDLIQNHWVCSANKIQEEIGFKIKIPIQEGLKTTYEWYLQEGWL